MALKVAVDLGTSETEIYTLGNGVVLKEATVVAITEGAKDKIKAIGNEAKKFIGKTSENTKISFPVWEGEVVNEKLTAYMLNEFFNTVKFNRFGSASVITSVPCGADVAILRKLNKVFASAGVNDVIFVESPIACAIGQNIPLSEYTPCFCIDMGGGVTSVAALSLDGIITGVSANIGGKNIDVWLIDYIADNFGLQIGLPTAERIKTQIGSLYADDTLSTVVNGRDLSTGRPRSIVVKAQDVLPPIVRYYDRVFEVASSVLSKLSPEVSAEIRHSGVYVSGGASAIAGLEGYYENKFGMQINVAEDPETATVRGLGILLGNNELLKRLKITEE